MAPDSRPEAMFHGKLDGETRFQEDSRVPRSVHRLDRFSQGFLVGLLVGEGHFGGDGRQPQVTLRMHVRHERLFRWLEATFPKGKLYGPYEHGGRRYYQWMARGPFLRDELAPLLLRRRAWLDDHVAERLLAMCSRYGIAVPEDVTGETGALAGAPRKA